MPPAMHEYVPVYLMNLEKHKKSATATRRRASAPGDERKVDQSQRPAILLSLFTFFSKTRRTTFRTSRCNRK